LASNAQQSSRIASLSPPSLLLLFLFFFFFFFLFGAKFQFGNSASSPFLPSPFFFFLFFPYKSPPKCESNYVKAITPRVPLPPSPPSSLLFPFPFSSDKKAGSLLQGHWGYVPFLFSPFPSPPFFFFFLFPFFLPS